MIFSQGRTRAPEKARVSGRTHRTLFAVFMVFFAVVPSHAEDRLVTVLYSSSSSAQRAVVNKIESVVNAGFSHRISLVSLDSVSDTQSLSDIRNSSLLITVGLQSALRSSQWEFQQNKVHVLLSASVLRSLLKNKSSNNKSMITGLHIDQPLHRFFELIRHGIPLAKKITVLCSDPASPLIKRLHRVIQSYPLEANIVKIFGQPDLIPTLEQALRDSDVLLALPDSSIYNRYTIQKILLTTYKKEIPVIAFSAALVRAGATMGVFSTPEQIGQEVGDLVLRYLTETDFVFPPQKGPQYFSTSINYQVARSLGLSPPPEAELNDLITRTQERIY